MIRLGKKWYHYFKSRNVDGRIKTVTIKRDSLGDIYVYIVSDVSAQEIIGRTGKQENSHNRRKARLDLARTYRKINNQRKDFHFKTARKICEEYAIICLEDLNLKGMQKLYGRKISDLGFYSFVQILKYEATKFGTQIVFIDRWNPSSQTCSKSGYKNPELKDLRIREWDSPKCKTHHDRDRNAAINIHRVGTSTLRGDEVRPDTGFCGQTGVCC